jgi:hypothetical protein
VEDMTDSMKALFEDMRLTIEDASARLLSITETESEARRSTGKWSAKEILGHLIDSAANNHPRFVTAQFKNDLIFSGYDQEAWVTTQRYQQASWPALITLWKSYNIHLLHVVSLIPPQILTRTRTEHNLDQIALVPVSRYEPTTLEYLIRDYVGHIKHHLRQILGT